MNAYMVSSSEPSEGAVLVFAETARAAKALAWAQSIVIVEVCPTFIDVRVKRMKESSWLLALKRTDGPEVIDDVPVCEDCELWGPYLNEKNLCESCADDREFDTP